MADKTTSRNAAGDRTYKSQAAADRAHHLHLAHTIVKPDGTTRKK